MISVIAAALGLWVVLFIWYVAQNAGRWLARLRWWLLPEAEKQQRLRPIVRRAIDDQIYWYWQ